MDQPQYFPPQIEVTAFRLINGEYAWRRSDLPKVFEYCSAANVAIVLGEVWVIRDIDNVAPDEPSEFIHNVDPRRNEKGYVFSRTDRHIVYSIFPLRSGETAILSWDVPPREPDQSWSEYVQITIDEQRRAIARLNVETEVVPQYSGDIHYNFMFEREDGTWF